MRQVQLQAGVTLSAVVDIADDGHETRLIGPRVEDRVELPVQAAPGGNVFLLPQLADIFLQYRVSFSEVFFRKMRDGQLQDLWLEQGADRKQFSDVIGRKGWDDGAAVGDDCDQAFGIQLAEGFADWDAADLILRSDCVLAELSAFGNLASNNLIAQLVGNSRGQRLAGNAGV